MAKVKNPLLNINMHEIANKIAQKHFKEPLTMLNKGVSIAMDAYIKETMYQTPEHKLGVRFEPVLYIIKE